MKGYPIIAVDGEKPDQNQTTTIFFWRHASHSPLRKRGNDNRQGNQKKDDRDDAKKKTTTRRDICVLYFVCHSTNCVAISIRVHCILNNVFPCSAEYIRG